MLFHGIFRLLSTHADRQSVDISVTVCVFLYTVTDFSAEDKASGVKFCRRFIGVSGRESLIFVNLAPQKPIAKSDESASARATPTRM